ncbi:MAG: hypothetical protein K9K40_09925 [Desulfotignum sp.]|nr:hypothetical protein [Desulfotignum sp.]
MAIFLKNIVNSVNESIRLYKKGKNPWPEGEEGLMVRDHQKMVGGKWDQIGRLQFEFMKKSGLKPEDILCDVACGSFRAGRFFISYLNPGNYLGIEKQQILVQEGKKKEIDPIIWSEKKPEIVISDCFEFDQFSKNPNFAIANSLFTHLSSQDIKLCLAKLFLKAAPGCKFFATYFKSDVKVFHIHKSHSSRRFQYTKSQMINFGEITGWEVEYIGDWKHPVNQVMVCYIKPGTAFSQKEHRSMGD